MAMRPFVRAALDDDLRPLVDQVFVDNVLQILEADVRTYMIMDGDGYARPSSTAYKEETQPSAEDYIPSAVGVLGGPENGSGERRRDSVVEESIVRRYMEKHLRPIPSTERFPMDDFFGKFMKFRYGEGKVATLSLYVIDAVDPLKGSLDARVTELHAFVAENSGIAEGFDSGVFEKGRIHGLPYVLILTHFAEPEPNR